MAANIRIYHSPCENYVQYGGGGGGGGDVQCKRGCAVRRRHIISTMRMCSTSKAYHQYK